MNKSFLEWSLLVAKGAQIDQTPALPTQNYIQNKTIFTFLFLYDLFISLSLSLFWLNSGFTLTDAKPPCNIP